MDRYHLTLREILKGKKDWTEIKQELSKYNIHDEDKKQKITLAGRIFEVFCKYYFKVTRTEIDSYKNIWLYNEIPLATLQQLNLTTTDHGIDLLLEDYQGEFYAVQCKFRNDENTKLNWTSDKIANLFGYCPKANGFIVFTNASDLDNVSKSRHDNFTFYNVSHLLEIDELTIQNIFLDLSNQKHLTPTFLTPRQHQKEAINACLRLFEKKDRGQLVLPCGAGKTLIALWLKESLKSENTLVLVPSLALLRQIKNDWSKQKKTNYHYLCVCSEKDIDTESQDAIVAHTYEVGGHVTTKTSEIWHFLGKNGEKVVFSTYQSLGEIALAIENKNFQFDFIFCDEAHKTAGIGKSTFSLVHDNNKIPSLRRLYATATPRIVRESLKKKLGDDLQYAYDMSDPNVFGEEFYRMSFKDAIEKDILVDYKIIAIGVNDKELQEFISERRFIDNKTSIDEIANNLALQFVMKKYNAFHALTFHSRVKYAKEFSERQRILFPEIKSFSVSGDQTTGERNLILAQFKSSSKSIISNARCLTEGVDVPVIDLVYFCDPKNSKVDIVQAVGRCLRKKDGKKNGYIVVPVYHYDKGSLEHSISQGSFKNLIQVIRSLCDQDERLQDEINSLATGKGGKKTNRIDLISTAFNEEFETIKLLGFEEKLRISLFEQIVEKTSNNWDLWFIKFKEFLEIHKKHPSQSDNSELYSWASQQRNKRIKNLSRPEEIKKLDSLNFIWDLHEFKWELMYSTLLEYRKANEFEPDDESDVTLATWYSTQKNLIKKKKLRADREHKIQEVIFLGPANRNKWLTQYDLLVNFRKEHPNEWPSYDKTAPESPESKLHVFCQIMRKRYRDGDLDDFWFDKFIALNFNFEGRQDNWLSYYNEIKNILEERKTISVAEIGHNAYSWIRRHWQMYNEGKLNDKKKILIENLNLPVFFESWNSIFSRVEGWLESEGKLPTRGTNSELYVWLYNQRARYKNGNLTVEEIEKLKQIGFDLLGLGKEKIKDRWNEQFNALYQFRSSNPGSWPSFFSQKNNEKKLYNWCQAQRQAQAGTHSGGKRKPLEEWQVEKLASINFKWSLTEINEEAWEENYQNLKDFLSINRLSELKVTNNNSYSPLYTWLANQKGKFNKGKLSETKILRLQELGITLSEEGFITSGRGNVKKWINSIKKIKEFVDKNNHLPKPSQHDKEERNLYNIVSKIKRDAKNNGLTQEQIELIRQVGILP